MERHLSLIKTDYEEIEKRIFPRFPFGFMIFRDKEHQQKIYEVKDISLTGMQIELKDGGHEYQKGNSIDGNLHWRSAGIDVKGKVQWVNDRSLGISFESGLASETRLRNFLSFENIVSHIKPLHEKNLELELPNDLKCWLKADGVLDIFVWELKTSGISKFQIMIMDHFIEWIEGIGVRTGKTMTQRNLETPLSLEDEFVFKIDSVINQSKIDIALGVVKKIDSEKLNENIKEFIIYKLSL